MTDLNLTGESHAHSLVAAGRVDRDAAWSFSAADGNALLGEGGDNWGEYAKWFLGLDRSADAKTKERYKYPFGKNGKVYRGGVIAAKQRAAQSGADAVEAAASRLLDLIDKNKSFAIFDCEVKDINDGGLLDFTISTSSIDRMGDTISVDGWQLDNYKRNPVVLWSHDPSKPVGRAANIRIEGGRLKATVDFYPNSNPEFGGLAESLRQLYVGGYLKATSVGFRPLKWDFAPERKSGIDFVEQELLEFSMVAIPANAEALINAKAAGISFDWLPAITDDKLIECAEAMLMRRDLFAGEAYARLARAFGSDWTPARQARLEELETRERIRKARARRERELDFVKLA